MKSLMIFWVENMVTKDWWILSRVIIFQGNQIVKIFLGLSNSWRTRTLIVYVILWTFCRWYKISRATSESNILLVFDKFSTRWEQDIVIWNWESYLWMIKPLMSQENPYLHQTQTTHHILLNKCYWTTCKNV